MNQTEKERLEVAKWLNSKGWDIELDKDGFWMEEMGVFADCKVKDIADLMIAFSDHQGQPAAIPVSSLKANDNDYSTQGKHVTGGLEFIGACVVESSKVIGDDGQLDMGAVAKCFDDANKAAGGLEINGHENNIVNWWKIRTESKDTWNEFLEWLKPNVFLDMKGNLVSFQDGFFYYVPLQDAILYISERIGGTPEPLKGNISFGQIEGYFLLIEDEFK